MLRPTLGDYSSIVCLKTIITGMEDALGEKVTAIALVSAGRNSGKKLVAELGLSKSDLTVNEIAIELDRALGLEGTRLCMIDKIEQTPEAVVVYTRETVCSSGEPQGSQRKCTYSLGVVWGAIEQIFGKRLQGKQTQSVLRGCDRDIFEFKDL